MIPIPVLADIKSVAPALERAWVGVRDKQFCHRGTPYDPPYRALVLVSDGVHDDALPGGEAQAELPALPANLPAADFEARAIGLDDLKRFEIVSQRSDAIGGIGARAAWQWHYAQVLHPYYRHIIEVHDGMKAVDRLGVRVVIRPLAIEQQRPRDSASRIFRCRERADPPCLHQHLLGVGDTAGSSPTRTRESALVTSSH